MAIGVYRTRYTMLDEECCYQLHDALERIV
jgi:hypothetical protein